MSWGDTFVSGFNATSDAMEKKKRRKQDSDLDALHRQLQTDLAAKQEAGMNTRLQQQLDAEAARQASQEDWQSGENATDRTFRTGERQGTEQFQSGQQSKSQEFQSTQNQLDRAARAAAQQKNLDFEQKKFDVDAPIQGLMAGLQARHQAWLEDPNNPYNQIRDAQAKEISGGNFGSLPPVGGQFTPRQSAFPNMAEGRIVIGPDGKRYKITNGQPVPVQ